MRIEITAQEMTAICDGITPENRKRMDALAARMGIPVERILEQFLSAHFDDWHEVSVPVAANVVPLKTVH